jgi:hypothetical protein
MSQGGTGYQLSKEAMLVGTVAALQEESGQMRSQWKSDVQRLEHELQQLRCAAAMALPHVQADFEPNLQLMMSTNTLAERVNGGGAMGQRSHSFGALSPRGAPPVEPGMSPAMPMQSPSMSPSMPMQAERGALGGNSLLSREASQLEAAMMHGSVSERAGRDQFADVPMARRSSVDSSGINLAEAVMNQMRMSQTAEQQAPAVERNSIHGASCEAVQIQELYKEVERLSQALAEAEQENRKLKEDKEEVVTAHSRDVNALEGMLDQLSAENRRLKDELSESNVKLRQFQMNGLDANSIIKLKQQSDTSASIRSASIEPALEPEVEQALDSEVFKLR